MSCYDEFTMSDFIDSISPAQKAELRSLLKLDEAVVHKETTMDTKDFIESLTIYQRKMLRELLDETEAKEDRPYTVEYTLWPENTLKSLTEYRNGKKCGKHMMWYRSGAKHTEFTYEDDVEVDYTKWFEDGTVSAEMHCGEYKK